MAGKKNYDQNRRDAMYWAEEWAIKQKRKKIFIALGALVAVVVLGFAINYLSILGSRTVFHSAEEMRAAVRTVYSRVLLSFAASYSLQNLFPCQDP